MRMTIEISKAIEQRIVDLESIENQANKRTKNVLRLNAEDVFYCCQKETPCSLKLIISPLPHNKKTNLPHNTALVPELTQRYLPAVLTSFCVPSSIHCRKHQHSSFVTSHKRFAWIMKHGL